MTEDDYWRIVLNNYTKDGGLPIGDKQRLAVLNEFITKAVLDGQIAERARFIAEDEAGRNAKHLALTRNAAEHDHDFYHDSRMCVCGVSRIFMIEAEDDITELQNKGKAMEAKT